ncbi:hypothetical protein [Streptomyces sp. NPDC046985]|uniref:hypothetical protein n=1 Tax=Streptomyces sp. NPDC046985 TaxID=3155377 RepID=UPI0033D09F91
MAHTAPVPARTAPVGARSPLPARPPDLFGPRAHALGRWAIPLAIGLVYGLWAASVRRSGGPITAGNVAFGFVSAVVFAVLMAAVLTVAPRLPYELHAVAWALFCGAAFGFLFHQAGDTVPLTILLGLLCAGGVGLMCFYRFSTHERVSPHEAAGGHRAG